MTFANSNTLLVLEAQQFRLDFLEQQFATHKANLRILQKNAALTGEDDSDNAAAHLINEKRLQHEIDRLEEEILQQYWVLKDAQLKLEQAPRLKRALSAG